MISVRRVSLGLDIIARRLGPLLALIAPLLIIFIGWVYLFVVLFQMQFSIFWIIRISLSSHLFLLILFNFYQSCTANVKYSPSFPDDLELVTCAVCAEKKGSRVHHCSVCHSCIDQMDHHCPWINNCVGKANHRFFYLFIVYLSIACIMISIHGFPIFYTEFWSLEKSYISWPFPKARVYFLFSFLVAILAGSALLSLCVWQSWLIITGQTTIEFYGNQVAKAVLEADFYDFGWKENILIFFSISPEYPWWLIFLPSTVSVNKRSKHISQCKIS